MLEQNSVYTIIITSVIAFAIAFFVRFGVRPKIETLYDKNRRSLLRGLLVDLNQVSRQFDTGHNIFEVQENFAWGEDVAYDLTRNQMDGLRFIQRDIQSIFNHIRERREFLLTYLTIDELDSMLNYIANALSFFAIPQSVEADENERFHIFYLSSRVDMMRHFGWRVINKFGLIMNYDYIRRIRRYDGLTTLE